MTDKSYSRNQTWVKRIIFGITGILLLFYMASCNSKNDSSPNIDKDNLLIPSIPGSLTQVLTCDKTTSVDLKWDAPPGTTYYKLYREGKEILENINVNRYTDTDLTPNTSYTYKVQACSIDGCSTESDTLTITTAAKEMNLENIILAGEVPEDLSSYDERSREIFSPYDAGASIVAKYIKMGGTKNGSSFVNYPAGNLKTVLDGITDASRDKIYVVLLTGGTYPAGATMAMKEHVAIVGGVNECLGSSDTVTALDGNDSYQVFNNNDLTNTALLYDLTIANGNSDEDGGGMANINSSPTLTRVTFSSNKATGLAHGGGMYNSNSFPVLTWVTFSNNQSSFGGGGGMANDSSSPSLTEVTFSGNTAGYGGGMANRDSSSPVLDRVTFSKNTALYAGGMYNLVSSPSLTEVTFSGNTADKRDGGGMYNHLSSPSLVRVTFSENTAKISGGGMYNQSDSSPSLTEVTFSKNTVNNTGGGMYNNSSSPILVGGTFSENTATYRGGGMYNEKGTPSLTNVTFSGNKSQSSSGGGMYNVSSSPVLDRVTFSKNTANLEGGGIYNIHSSPILVGGTFSENTANNQGGGIYNNNSSPSLTEITFSGNNAQGSGGGMYNYSSSPILVGGTFSENTAGNYGGGMYSSKSSLPVLTGVTFFTNTAEHGGGMANNNDGGAGPLIVNSIFWGNIATSSGPEFHIHNAGTSQENLRIYNSIIQGGTSNLSSGTNYTSLNNHGRFSSSGGTALMTISFSNIIADDPELGALANNGGSVLTHAIPSDSPAVNQGLYVRKSNTKFYFSPNNADWYTKPDLSGNPIGEPAETDHLTAKDATGYVRTDTPDIGAYEAEARQN